MTRPGCRYEGSVDGRRGRVEQRGLDTHVVAEPLGVPHRRVAGRDGDGQRRCAVPGHLYVVGAGHPDRVTPDRVAAAPRHVELETLLRSTLVSAERAAQDMKEHARREADVIVQEANAESRRLLRDAIAEKEQLLAETHRIRTMMRAALEIVSDGHSAEDAAVEREEPGPAEPAEARIERLAG